MDSLNLAIFRANEMIELAYFKIGGKRMEDPTAPKVCSVCHKLLPYARGTIFMHPGYQCPCLGDIIVLFCCEEHQEYIRQMHTQDSCRIKFGAF